MLNNNQIRFLRGRCHQLADHGLTENVQAEIELALNSHELIKIKLRGEREQRSEWIDSIVQSTRAELVQKIGQVACFYRPNPEKRQIQLP